MEYVPLARAAVLAHERLFPEESSRRRRRSRPLSAEEIADGVFTRGATRLEFPDRPTLRFLVVRRDALDGAIKALVDDPLVAGRVSLTLRQSPKSAARGGQGTPPDRTAS